MADVAPPTVETAASVKTTTLRYKAFISYSHRADRALAPALQAALNRFGRPWYRVRWMSIFRDDTDLGISPHLWGSIQSALSQAEYFVLLASPLAAESAWVEKEVNYWRASRPSERLLIVLTDGEIEWDDAHSDFDWTRTTALPTALAGAFPELPFHADLRQFKARGELAPTNPAFLNEVAKLSATIQARPLREIFGEEVRQRRLRAAAVVTVMIVLSILAGAAIWSALRATRALAQSRSRELAAASRIERANPELSLVLARKAVKTVATPEAVAALREGLASSPLTLILHGSEQGLTDAAFSPDGHWAVTAGLDGVARLFDTTRGERVVDFRGHAAEIDRVLFSPNGSLVLTASDDGTVRLWDVASRQPACEPLRHPRGLRDAGFNPDGTRIVTACLDHLARIWDVKACTLVRELKGHGDALLTASYSSDGSRIVTAGLDDSPRVWNAANGELLAVLEGGEGEFAAFSPDGSKIVSAGQFRTLAIWDTSGGKLRTRVDVSEFGHRPAFSSDGKRVLLASGDPAARIWDAETGEQITEWKKPEDLERTDWANPGSLLGVYSPEGDQVLTTNGQTARLWDASTGRESARFGGHTNEIRSIQFTRDGRRAITSSFDGTARIWRTNAGRTVGSVEDLGDPPEAAVFSADTSNVAIATREHGLRLYRVGTPAPTRVLASGGRMYQGVALNRDLTFVLGNTTPYAQLFATASGDVVASLETRDAPGQGEFSRDGRLFAAGLTIDAGIWDTKTGHLLKTLHGHTDHVRYTAFSPDGSHVVTGSNDRTARVWDVASGKTLLTLEGHAEAVVHVGFSSDGARVLTTSDDYTARLWDAASGAPLAILAGPTDSVSQAVFSVDDRWVAAIVGDGTVRIWDPIDGQELARYSSSGDRPLALAFRPSGELLVFTQSGRLILVECELCAGIPALDALAAQRIFHPPTASEVRRYHLDDD